MWEQIRVNKRNSVILLSTMALCLIALGAVLGLAFGGGGGVFFGVIIATVIWLVLMVVSFSSGDQILLASSKAKLVTYEVHPQLFNVVEEMKIAANLPKMPKIYIINDPSPNAFATGRSPERASVAVTAGLLARLNRDELQGVIAHEMSHIVNRDILFITLAGVMLGSIVLMSQVFLRGMFYSSMGSSRRFSSRSSNQGGAQILFLVIALVAAILAPIFVQILYFSLSRRREYLADAGAVRLSRYPEGLASA
ncbi:MAG: M48 family metallopeptidase, partial [Dehalococcoidales bacterium]